MTSLQIQYLLCTPLARSTARTHQQPKIATSGYFTWETGPWQQEKQHQMSQVSEEYRHRQSETVSVKTSLLWRSTETSASTCNGPMVQQSKGLGPAKLEVSLVQRWIKIHAAEKRWPYTVSQVKYPDVAILRCWCIRVVLQANGEHNRYWIWSDSIWTL
jgi:hypothetical protein